jgi:hypothetical protein
VTTAALLPELQGACAHHCLAGNDLHYQTRPSIRIAGFAEPITAHKQALLIELRQRELAREEAVLERGWSWLEEHPNDPRHAAFEQRWIARLREYERTYRLIFHTAVPWARWHARQEQEVTDPWML